MKRRRRKRKKKKKEEKKKQQYEYTIMTISQRYIILHSKEKDGRTTDKPK